MEGCGKASAERRIVGIFRLRVPTRFARRHASLKMTMGSAIEVKERAEASDGA